MEGRTDEEQVKRVEGENEEKRDEQSTCRSEH